MIANFQYHVNRWRNFQQKRNPRVHPPRNVWLKTQQTGLRLSVVVPNSGLATLPSTARPRHQHQGIFPPLRTARLVWCSHPFMALLWLRTKPSSCKGSPFFGKNSRPQAWRERVEWAAPFGDRQGRERRIGACQDVENKVDRAHRAKITWIRHQPSNRPEGSILPIPLL